MSVILNYSKLYVYQSNVDFNFGLIRVKLVESKWMVFSYLDLNYYFLILIFYFVLRVRVTIVSLKKIFYGIDR